MSAYDRGLDRYNFPHPDPIIKKDFCETYGYHYENFKIISDAVHNIRHYGKASHLILDQPLAMMEMGGASCKPSLRNLLEQLLCMFRFHRFPAKIKALRAAEILYFVLRKRFGI